MARCEDFDRLTSQRHQEIRDNYPPKYVITIEKTKYGVVERSGRYNNELGDYEPSYPKIIELSDSEGIFTQTVSDIDLTAIVKAVNGIK